MKENRYLSYHNQILKNRSSNIDHKIRLNSINHLSKIFTLILIIKLNTQLPKIEIQRFKMTDTGKKIKLYHSRIKKADISISENESEVILYPNN